LFYILMFRRYMHRVRSVFFIRGAIILITLGQTSCLPSSVEFDDLSISTYLMTHACQNLTALQSTDVCTSIPLYTVGGTVTGLNGTGMVLQNGSELLSVSANGAFQFQQTLRSGQTYAVSVQTNPSSPAQMCTVSGSSGTIVSDNVTTVTVNCSDAFTVGGAVAGLAGSGLQVLLNGSYLTSITANGSYSFPALLLNGDAYSVSIVSQPLLPSQTCTLTGGSGVIAGADITSASISCVTNTYPLNIVVFGVNAGTLDILDSVSGQTLSITTSGTTNLPLPLSSGDAYNLSITGQPSGHACVLSAATGTVASTNPIVIANCTSDFIVSGTISGLAGSGSRIKLQNTGGTPFTSQVLYLSAGQSVFSFTPIPDGASYQLTIESQPGSPVWQTCSLAGPISGTIAGADIVSISMGCVTDQFGISGTVFGYTGSGLRLRLNGLPQINQDLNIPTGSTSFDFTTATVKSGGTYTVSIAVQPTGPSQSCSVTGSPGTITNASINMVVVNCDTNAFTVGGTVDGVITSFSLLETVSGQTLTINADGTFTLPAPIASGASYNLTVAVHPANQTCTVSGGAGTVAASNITGLAVHCSPLVTATTPTEGATNEKNSQLQISFSTPMDPATLTTNGGTESCTGTIQVSYNNFLTCAPLGALTSGNNRDFDVVLPQNLYANTQYRLRILGLVPGVRSAAGLQMDADFAQVAGFNTGGLVRYYSFSSGSLDHRALNDAGTGSFVLTATGTAMVTGNAGDPNGSLRFNTGNVLSGVSTGLPSGNSQRTLCSWVTLNSYPPVGAEYTIAGYGTAGNTQSFSLAIVNNAGTMQARVSGFGVSVDLNARLPINTWTHLCATYNGNTITIYQNGRSIGSQSGLIWNTDNSGPLTISSPTTSFRGRIDDIRIYDSVLPENQIHLLATRLPSGLQTMIALDGDTRDDTTRGKAGTATGGFTLMADRSGLPGRAYRLDGLSQYVEFLPGDLPSLPLGGAARSLCAWIYPQSLPMLPGQWAIASWGTGANSTILQLRADFFQQFITFTNDPTTTLLQVPYTTPRFVWTHVCATYDGGTTGALFINGVQVATSAALPAFSTPASSFFVGRSALGWDLFHGGIDDVRIYNRALSAAEVASLSGPHPMQITGLRFHGMADAIDPTTADGTPIASWNSEGLAPLTVTAPATAPLYRPATASEPAALDFQGLHYYSWSSAIPLASNDGSTMLIVTKPTSYPASYASLLHVGGIDAGGGHQYNILPSGSFQLAAGNATPFNLMTTVWTFPQTHYTIASAVINNSSTTVASFFSDTGSNATSFTARSFSLANELYIGNAPGSGSSYNGRIAEIIYFNNSVNRMLSFCYLSAKHSIPANNAYCDF